MAIVTSFPASANAVEINADIGLSQQERLLLDNHSLLNLFNVLEKQLSGLSSRCASPLLLPFQSFCVDMLTWLSEPDFGDQVDRIEEHFRNLAHILKDVLRAHPEEFSAIEVLLEILQVGISRLGELRADRFTWTWMSCDAIRRKLTEFLAVTQSFGSGRFNIGLAPGQTEGSNVYVVEFAVGGRQGLIFAPPVLNDTLRDLVANARKYSPAGTTISVLLAMRADNSVLLRVADQGIGVPKQEIPRIVEYGYRASNARHRQTMGGGYGLTKAYLLCKRFNGRFFITSAPGKGTTIEFSLQPPCRPPIPACPD